VPAVIRLFRPRGRRATPGLSIHSGVDLPSKVVGNSCPRHRTNDFLIWAIEGQRGIPSNGRT
jgi:hypothetical protein